MSSREPALLDHEYDGIREYDNPTPGWWHAIFLGSIVFSVFYFIFFQFSPMAWTPHSILANRELAEFKRVFGTLGELEGDEPTILKMMSDPTMLAIAKGRFLGTCAACHARDGGAGGGFTGVNLCDDSYKNVKVLPDIFTVITKGANNGAMQSWETRISKNERVILAAYVATLRGTTPASAKPAEGEVIPAWPALPPPEPPAPEPK